MFLVKVLRCVKDYKYFYLVKREIMFKILYYVSSFQYISRFFLCPWYLRILIAHDSMSGKYPHINVKVTYFYSTCLIGIGTLCSCSSRKGSISVLSTKSWNCTTTASGTPPFMVPSESLYTKSKTVPLVILLNPTSVHKFDVNMPSAPTEKYNTDFKLFASLESLLAVLAQLCL